MKKIAFLCQDLVGEGAQHATAMLVRGFVARGCKVDLLVSSFHDVRLGRGELAFETPSEARWIRLPSVKARHNISAIRKYLKETDAECVVAMGMNYEDALAIASVGLWRRPRLYTVEHGIRFALSRTSLRERLRRRFNYSRMDGVLAVSNGVKDSLCKKFGLSEAKVSVVYNPVVDDAFFRKLLHPARHPWIADKNMPVVVTAGTLSQAKDHLTLIKAIEVVRKSRPVRLVIFGEGSYRAEYESYIRERGLEDVVSMPGFTDNLPAEERMADCYVSSSRLESFGIAIVEALASGVPVVSTDCPCGPREILQGGEFGDLVPVGDVEAMASAIERCLDRGKSDPSPESWSRFTIDAIVARYELATCGVEMLEPYVFDRKQFFRQWAAETWVDAGGATHRDMTMAWPWRLKMLVHWLGLVFGLPRCLKNGRRLLVTSGGLPQYLVWPYCYRYDVVPMVWDCWPRYWRRLVGFLRRHRVRTVICTSRQTRDYVARQLPGVKAVWCPEGIKTGLYPMGDVLVRRTNDVMKMGRDADGRVLYKTHEELTRAMRESKVLICRPRCDTHPQDAGSVETLTQRYWEGMLSGCVVVGRAPRELVDFCGYNPVVEGVEVADVLSDISRYQDLVNKNRKFAEENADWSKRIPLIVEALEEGR